MTSDPTSQPPALHAIDGPGVASVADDIAALYALSYAEPPWSEGPEDIAAFRTRLRVWAAERGFVGLLARRPDGALVGAAYGWWGASEVGGTPLPGVDHELVFHVGDLMVHPAARGRGLGRGLLDQLVTGRRPAALVTHPESAARHLYDAAGWACTGLLTPPGTAPLLTFILG
jgi:GNAT superfamily N-acetyltransferase